MLYNYYISILYYPVSFVNIFLVNVSLFKFLQFYATSKDTRNCRQPVSDNLCYILRQPRIPCTQRHMMEWKQDKPWHQVLNHNLLLKNGIVSLSSAHAIFERRVSYER